MPNTTPESLELAAGHSVWAFTLAGPIIPSPFQIGSSPAASQLRLTLQSQTQRLGARDLQPQCNAWCIRSLLLRPSSRLRSPRSSTAAPGSMDPVLLPWLSPKVHACSCIPPPLPSWGHCLMPHDISEPRRHPSRTSAATHWPPPHPSTRTPFPAIPYHHCNSPEFSSPSYPPPPPVRTGHPVCGCVAPAGTARALLRHTYM